MGRASANKSAVRVAGGWAATSGCVGRRLGGGVHMAAAKRNTRHARGPGGNSVGGSEVQATGSGCRQRRGAGRRHHAIGAVWLSSDRLCRAFTLIQQLHALQIKC